MSQPNKVDPRAPDPGYGPGELEEARDLMERALSEDAPRGDVTSDLFFPAGETPAAWVEAAFSSRSPGVLAGVALVRQLFRVHAPLCQLTGPAADGQAVLPRDPWLVVRGPARDVLRLERVALNFLQRLSGIATLTHQFVEAARGTSAKILDTRKTTPGWRRLEKFAVRCGGGTNHRQGLSDAVLIKDNHVGILRQLGRGGLEDWISRARRAHPGLFVELEVDNRGDFLDALPTGVDSILLDNFPVEEVRWAVAQRNLRGTRPLLEASGGMRLERIGEVARSGVDRISVGALTHSAPALDIGLDFTRAFLQGDS